MQSLLPTDKSAPVRIYLPDISTSAISHLMNILKQGFTTGNGSGDVVSKQIKEAATSLGFDEIPLLSCDGERPLEQIAHQMA